MNRTLLYIVRNNFEDKYYGHSILGVFSSLWKAYQAGHKKWLEIHEEYPNHRMELKVVKQDMSDYMGCSAYVLNFAQSFSEVEILEMQKQIEEWTTWKHFEYIQEEKKHLESVKAEV